MINALLEEKTVEKSQNQSLVVVRRRTYKKMSEFELHKMFTEEQAQEKIISSLYSQNEWVLLDRYRDFQYPLSFKTVPLKDELKAFTVIYLEDNQPSTVATAVRFLFKVLEETNGLQKDVINIKNLGAYTTYMTDILIAFLSFIEADEVKTRIIIETIKTHEKESSNKSRSLPNIQSVMLFNRIIEDFINKYLEEIPVFYPIVLWWKLTMIIPMRPIEFFQLKATDFYEDNGTYWIHIQRSLKSGENDGKHRIPLITEFQIDRATYNLFCTYLNSIELGDQGFIFNSEGIDIRYDREFMGRHVLGYLHDKFYKVVIEEIYGLTVIDKESKEVLGKREIERINYGDTRHLAFLDLIVSGFNPYTIAQLGGHRQLSTQNFYYAGITTFCTSKAYSLAYGIIELDNTNALAMTNWRKNELLKNTADLSSCRRISNGYCTSKNFPYECGSADCAHGECPYHISDNAADISEQKKRIQEDMERKVEILKSIMYKEPNDSITRSEVTNGLQEDIVKLARLVKCETLPKEEK